MRRRVAVLFAVPVVLASCTSSGHTGHTGHASASSARPPGTIAGDPHGSFEARPLVAPGAAVQSGRSGVSITRLGFPLPADETAYDQLTALTAGKLASALSAVDCSHPGVDTARNRVVCTQDTSRTALLTGRPVLTAADVASTRAVPPGSGISQWTIQITLTPGGRAALSSYTTTHHAEQSRAVSSTQCAAGTVPCADFIAFITRGVAVSVPVSLAPITNGVISIAGAFAEGDATALALQLAS